MRYLSDVLSVSINTYAYKGQTLTYNVYMVNAFQGGGQNLIYTGRLYCTGVTQTIYLNDIIASHTYNNSYVWGQPETNPSGVLFDIRVVFSNGISTMISSDPYIMNCYMDKGVERRDILQADGLFEGGEGIYNALSFRSNVLPRIPRLSFQTNNFTLSALLFVDEVVCEDGDYQVRIAGYKDDRIIYALTEDASCITPVSGIRGSYYRNLTATSDSIWACNANGSTPTVRTKIANVDACPARYYLTWIDRTGGWMCWPFDGRCIMNEDISTSYKTDLLNNQSPYRQDVTTRWTLNTKSLSFDERKALESILVSPYCCLYDTEIDEASEVTVNTKTYEVKTKDNTKGLFNLSLEVQTSSIQNIVY